MPTAPKEAKMFEVSQYTFVAAFAALALALLLYVVNVIGVRGVSRLSLATEGSLSSVSLAFDRGLLKSPLFEVID